MFDIDLLICTKGAKCNTCNVHNHCILEYLKCNNVIISMIVYNAMITNK